MLLRSFRILVCIFICALLTACSSKGQPSNINNICHIFAEKPTWYKAANKSVEKWGGNIHVPMSIIYQESSFKADARPPRRFILGVIPRGRASDAYGYSQALKSTWAEYEKATGNKWASRESFSASIDFVLWYMNQSYQRNKVSKWDARAQYLNYHEGQGGYARGTHNSKQWLLNTANRVQSRAERYAAQLKTCQGRL